MADTLPPTADIRPWLQTDNDFTLTDTTGTYDAGTQVRQLVTDGDDAIEALVPEANTGHPGQLSFLDGVPQKFSTHEPDATTPVGNASRWVNQTGDGDAIEVWYHPNRLGQIAYSELLIARGTFGAPTGPGGTASPSPSVTPSSSPSTTPTGTPTATSSATATSTSTATASGTPTGTPTATATTAPRRHPRSSRAPP